MQTNSKPKHAILTPPASLVGRDAADGSVNPKVQTLAAASGVRLAPGLSGNRQLYPWAKVGRLGCQALLACVAALAPGCSWTDSNGTHRVIAVVGFGVLTVTNRPGVDVNDIHALGLSSGSRKVGIGWSHERRVVIDPELASNVAVSIRATPGKLAIENFAVDMPTTMTDETNKNNTMEVK